MSTPTEGPLDPFGGGPLVNADLVQPFVDRAKRSLTEALRYGREHPDEVAVRLAPVLAVNVALSRHKLSWPESLLVFVVANACGELALRQYREWKLQPSGR